jgi:hypothetical protein
VAKVRTSDPDRTISLKRLQCVVENKNKTADTLTTTLVDSGSAVCHKDRPACSAHISSINVTMREWIELDEIFSVVVSRTGLQYNGLEWTGLLYWVRRLKLDSQSKVK